MYADDKTIRLPGKNQTEVTKNANDELNSIYSWLENHKLLVNTQKIKYMILSTKPHCLTNTNSSCIKNIKQRDF